MAQQALDRPGRGVAERADGMALDLIGHIEQRVDLVELGIAAHQAGHHAPHPAGALAAGRALAAALVHVEVREAADGRSEEHTSELQSLMRISYAVFCLKKKKIQTSRTAYLHIMNAENTKSD